MGSGIGIFNSPSLVPISSPLRQMVYLYSRRVIQLSGNKETAIRDVSESDLIIKYVLTASLTMMSHGANGSP